MDTQATRETQAVSPTTKTLTVNIWAAMGVLATAILVSVVGTAFTIGNSLNNDHFLLQSTAQALTEIKSTYIRSDIYTINQATLNSSLAAITNRLDSIDRKLDKTK